MEALKGELKRLVENEGQVQDHETLTLIVPVHQRVKRVFGSTPPPGGVAASIIPKPTSRDSPGS
jgi:hypothetical protein